jgi:hypothetical protein
MTAYVPQGAFKSVVFLAAGISSAVQMKVAGLADVHVKPEQRFAAQLPHQCPLEIISQ